MKNNKNLIDVFKKILEIGDDEINDDLKYQSIPQWDSINHMYLISEIEAVFDLEIEPDRILEIKSFEAAKQVLKNYGIEF